MNKIIVLLIAQTRIVSLDFEKKRGIGYQVIAELAYIPDSFIVDNSDEIIKMIDEYINYSYQLPGYKQPPNWFRDEWIPEDW